MSLKYTMEFIESLDDPTINGRKVCQLFNGFPNCEATYQTIQEDKGQTDFIKILIKGEQGKKKGGDFPSIGIIGRLGGIGARPSRKGLVSDGDGAIAALVAAKKLAEMNSKGDTLLGDAYITTHICPAAPTEPHKPVEFMGSPVEMATMNRHEVLPEMDAILSVDTTKGNNLFNHKGVAISPTVKSGYILKFNDNLIRLLETTKGNPAVTFAITTQDITPYGNGVFHINSIMQPSTATDAPVVGVAITSGSVIPGSATGASHEIDIAEAAKFCIEAAKEYTDAKIDFYDKKEFSRLVKLYGEFKVLQSFNNEPIN